MITPNFINSLEGEVIVEGLLDRFQAADGSCQAAVTEILDAVKERKNDAVLEYCRQFDAPDLTVEQLQVSTEELQQAYELVDDGFLDTIGRAIERIQSFHEREMEDSWFQTREDGTIVGRMVRPVDSAGLYVPVERVDQLLLSLRF